MADRLGGTYFVDVDNFADRDFASTPYVSQNDLDYYLTNGQARILHVGDKYNYDYYAHVRNAEGWVNGNFVFGNLSANVGGRLGYTSFWREGLIRKGLFPGQPDNAQMAALWEANGVVATEETSLGKSDVARFLTFAGKAGVSYVIGGNMRVYGNVGYFQDAPHFNQAFLSPRTRNSMVQGLKPIKTFTSDVNWQFSGSGINARVTAYYTTIKDQSKIMSAYDDVQNAFSNFAISGINQRHYGVELGFKVPTYIVPNLSVQGVFAWGRAEYTSKPTMVQTLDNSAKPVSYNGQSSVLLRYWDETPVYTKDAYGNIPEDTDISQYKKTQKHYVPSTPQLAASLGLNWNYNYWFVDLDVEYFDEAYLDMNPLYRTDYAVQGPDGKATPQEVVYMTTQEKFDPCLLLNVSVGKSWFIQRKYQLGFSLNAKNLLGNKLINSNFLGAGVKTGGYEQTRMIDNTKDKTVYYKFDPKYFYMAGTNYMLNIYFRF